MLNTLKTLTRKSLNRLGYQISRLPVKSPPPPAPTERRIATAHYHGQPFQCFLDDCIGEYILTGKGWDNQLASILSQLGEQHKTGDIVEIGANIGASFVPIAKQFPQFQFHCVEPVPAFYTLLEYNAAHSNSNNLHLYPIAVSATVGEQIEIHTQIGTAGAIAEYDGHQNLGAKIFTSTTIDEQFADQTIQLLKIDVDGFEHQVLHGAKNTLQRCQPWIFMEFHAHLMDKMGTDPHTITSQLQQAGYNYIYAWDNVGKEIGLITDFAALIQQARATHCYLDILLQCR